VILADTMTPPCGPRPPRLLDLPGGGVIWAGRKDDDVPPVATSRATAQRAAEDEYRRLLYVAMTRAADRLIVCGADGERKRPDGCWYDLIVDPLQAFLVSEQDGGETVFRYHKPTDTQPAARGPAAEPLVTAPRRELPLWLRQPVPVEALRRLSLSPSLAFENESAGASGRAAPSIAERRKALARGRIVHRLLQSLPDIPPRGREAAAAKYLDSAAADFSPLERAELAQQVLAILHDAAFAEVFAPGSRAEVPIVGRLPRPGDATVVVSGQVDRLAVTGDCVLMADYKTDRAVPRELAEVPRPYIGQLAAYRAVLMRIYPKRTIRAALIFVDGPKIVELPEAAMEAELAAYMSRVTPR